MDQPSLQPDNTQSVALFGEVLADIFPDRRVLGGAPFNVARHLRAFGLAPLLISRSGDDALRQQLLAEMNALDMEAGGVQIDHSHPTGQVRVILENGGHRFDILPDQAYDHICPDATRAALAGITPVLAYFGSLALRSATSRAAAEQFLQHSACPIFLDLNLRAPWYDAATVVRCLQAADIVKLNDEELAEVARLLGLVATTAEAQAMELQQCFGIDQVLVTCGSAGSWLLDRNHNIHPTHAHAHVDVVDTVGAGDACAAVFMLGTLLDWELETTLQRASDYAAALCGVRGAAPPSDAFVEDFRQAWNLSSDQR